LKLIRVWQAYEIAQTPLWTIAAFRNFILITNQ